MKKFCAVIAFGAAMAFGVPSAANAQQPAASAPQPAASAAPAAPVVDTVSAGTVVYDWGNPCSQVVPLQSYSVSYQPVYYTRYYSSPCSTVYYTQPTCCYTQPTCYYTQPTYYYSSCWQTSRRSFRFCR